MSEPRSRHFPSLSKVSKIFNRATHRHDDSKELYLPLREDEKEIRLLTVRPGKPEDPVHCSMSVVSLNSNPDYETISYYWGDPTRTDEIFINGQRIMIPRNTKLAIRRMRMRNAKHVLWIDAVCINQDDPEERSSQVSIMRKIYGGGMRNLIYLGEDPKNEAKRVLAHLRYIAPAVKRIYDEGGENVSSQQTQSIPTAELDRLDPLYSIPWFRRLWIVQEAVLAKSNLCHWGSQSFPLTELIEFAYWCTMSGDITPPKSIDAAGALQLNVSLRKLRTSRTLMELGYNVGVFQTTDPRDHIYAVLGLMYTELPSKDIPQLIRPSYHESVAHVFRDATRHALNEVDGGYILNRVSHKSDADMFEGGYTSWTNRWNRTSDPLRDAVTLATSFSAGIRSAPDGEVVTGLHLAEPKDMDVLTLHGFLTGRVSPATPPMDDLYIPDRLSLARTINVLHNLLDERTTVTHESFVRAMTLILTAGNIDDWKYSQEQTAIAFQDMCDYIASGGPWPPIMGLNTEERRAQRDDICWRLYSHVLVALKQRRLFATTTNGYIGVGPKTMRKDDIAVIFKGVQYPCILRPAGKEYHFIGVCYIYGLMNGELFNENPPLQSFDIR